MEQLADIEGHSLNIKIYPFEVSNIQRGAAEFNIISTRVDKSYIQQEMGMLYLLYYIPPKLFLNML